MWCSVKFKSASSGLPRAFHLPLKGSKEPESPSWRMRTGPH